MRQEIFNAELQAAEVMLLIFQSSLLAATHGLLLFMDSLGVISAIINDDYETDKSNIESGLIRVRALYRSLNVEIIWIPSHISEKQLTPAMTAQINYLKDRFKHDFERIVHANNMVDKAANSAYLKWRKETSTGNQDFNFSKTQSYGKETLGSK